MHKTKVEIMHIYVLLAHL